MQIQLSSQVVSQFLSGLIGVLALVVVGGLLSMLLRGMAKRFPFSRLALVFALSPLSLVRFLDQGDDLTLYLYAMIVLLIGISVDGISYLLEPKITPMSTQEAELEETGIEEDEEKTSDEPNVIVWEKAE